MCHRNIVDVQMWRRLIQMHYTIEQIQIRITFLKSLYIPIQNFYCRFCIFRQFAVFIHYRSIFLFSYLHNIFIKSLFLIARVFYLFQIIVFLPIFALLCLIIITKCLPEAFLICIS